MKQKLTFLAVFICMLFSTYSLHTQPLADSVSQKRISVVKVSSAALYGATMAGLGLLWYADNPTRSFHFLNDGGAWLWMDKFGHAYATYQVGRTLHQSLRWAGIPNKKATLCAAGGALAAITSIEIFDGFSEGWGASPSDALANLSGTVLFASQQLLWQEEKIRFRWSYANPGFAQYRPNALGSNTFERWLKDYNGQVYWLSASPASFMPKTKFPKWLGLAVGYSASGILGGSSNPTTVDGQPIPNFLRQRQFLVGPDIFLDTLKTKSKVLNTLLFLSGAIKFPLPALMHTQEEGWSVYMPF